MSSTKFEVIERRRALLKQWCIDEFTQVERPDKEVLQCHIRYTNGLKIAVDVPLSKADTLDDLLTYIHTGPIGVANE